MRLEKYLCLTLMFGFSYAVVAQEDPVLMTVNGKQVHRSEFEYFYNKNINFERAKQVPLEEYVELFVDFKLKVAAAEQVGMDTTSAFREELEECRRQLAASYLAERTVGEAMARKEYERMSSVALPGKLCLSQIFFRLSQQAPHAEIRRAELRMDSLYRLLKQDETRYEEYVSRFSDSKDPFWVDGLHIPDELEPEIVSLGKGAFSRPFYTSGGIHIVKIIERGPLPPFEQIREELMRKQLHPDAMDTATVCLIENLKTEYGYIPDERGISELLAQGSTKKILFKLAGIPYTGDEFARFSLTRTEDIRRRLNLFVTKSVLDYENSRLEYKFPGFRMLMQEYRDGILLYEISDREVWSKAVENVEEQENYFRKNRSRYRWEKPRYKGIVLQCSRKDVARKIRQLLKKLPESEWLEAIRLTANAKEKQVQAIQGVFSPGDNPFVDASVFRLGKAKADLRFPFTVLLGKKHKEPESYKEVYATLIDDYQKDLEMHWLKHLRTIFKVEIDQEVLKTVNNH